MKPNKPTDAPEHECPECNRPCRCLDGTANIDECLCEHGGSERVAAEPVEPSLACRWTNEVDYWHSSCGEDWCFTEGGPKENRARFCQGCGKAIEIYERTESL